MTEYLKAIGLAMVPLALLLPLAVAIERRWSHTHYSMRQRLPGALYIVLIPAIVTGVSWPLHRLWDHLGVTPLIDISGWPWLVKFAALLLLFDLLR